jgi:Domain of unknown function (DUF5753)
VVRLIKVLTFGPEILVRILEDLVEGEVSPEWTGKWLAIEKLANMLLSYEHSVVPGLLQTPEYADTVLRFSQHLSLDVAEKIQTRLGRQEILRADDAPSAVFVMDERVLRNLIGNAKIMHDQLLSLVDFAKLPNVIIQIIPNEAGYHLGQAGAFMIAKFNGTEVVYQDGTWRGQVLEDIEDVAAFSHIWMNLHGSAMNKTASIALIEKVTEEWNA